MRLDCTGFQSLFIKCFYLWGFPWVSHIVVIMFDQTTEQFDIYIVSTDCNCLLLLVNKSLSCPCNRCLLVFSRVKTVFYRFFYIHEHVCNRTKLKTLFGNGLTSV